MANSRSPSMVSRARQRMLKILATRERDLEDAVTVVRSLASRIDMDLIERELGALAIEISDHDVMGRWQRAQGRLPKGLLT